MTKLQSQGREPFEAVDRAPEAQADGFATVRQAHESEMAEDYVELIAELIAPQETERASVKVIAHTLRGNVLWSVAEVTARAEGVHRDLAPGQSLRYIRCDLLERSGSQWGYKPLDESMHPYYYSCPLSYLDMTPEQSADWRAGVRAYHARRRTPTASTAPAAALLA